MTPKLGLMHPEQASLSTDIGVQVASYPIPLRYIGSAQTYKQQLSLILQDKIFEMFVNIRRVGRSTYTIFTTIDYEEYVEVEKRSKDNELKILVNASIKPAVGALLSLINKLIELDEINIVSDKRVLNEVRIGLEYINKYIDEKLGEITTGDFGGSNFLCDKGNHACIAVDANINKLMKPRAEGPRVLLTLLYSEKCKWYTYRDDKGRCYEYKLYLNTGKHTKRHISVASGGLREYRVDKLLRYESIRSTLFFDKDTIRADQLHTPPYYGSDEIKVFQSYLDLDFIRKRREENINFNEITLLLSLLAYMNRRKNYTVTTAGGALGIEILAESLLTQLDVIRTLYTPIDPQIFNYTIDIAEGGV